MIRTLLCLLVASVIFSSEPAPLRVVSTTTILADLVRNVGGPRVASVSLLRPGVDAHVYQPSPTDAAALAGARLVVVSGLGFEGWIDQLVEQSGYRGAVAVASAGVTPLGFAEGGANRTDPHFWNDVRNGMLMVGNIRDALTAADPAGKDDYAALADLYLAQLRALDAWARRQIATLPERSRVLVTSHDALQYFGKAYGLELHAIEGIATGQEPDARHVAELIALLRAKRVRAVFFETVTSPKVAEQIGKDGGAVLGGALFSDCLGDPAGPGGTYIGMISSNVTTIVDGLKP